MGIETEGAGVVEGKIPYTYKEDIEQKRLWLERKIKRELKIVINAIIDKVIWKGCNLDVLVMAVPQIPNGVSKKRIPKAGSGHQKLCQKRSVPVL